jgi:hypothetical protein
LAERKFSLVKKENARLPHKDAVTTALPPTASAAADLTALRSLINSRPYAAMSHIFDDLFLTRALVGAYFGSPKDW